MGQFPDQSEYALISLAWLEAAQLREGKPDGRLIAGIDVAGPGEDETVLAVRDGDKLIHLQWWTKPDPRGEVLAALRPFQARLAMINGDTAGIGYYFLKHIQDHGFPVTHVNVGAAPLPERFAMQEKRLNPQARNQYANLKAQLYWNLRLRFQDGEIAGIADERTIGQLAGIRWATDSRGNIVIESKDEARKRGVKSPDRAEAIMLCYHDTRATDKVTIVEEMKQSLWGNMSGGGGLGRW
jgi:hypothetical protein